MKIQTTTIGEDIAVFYVTASSFPEGVMSAHEKLHALVPPDGKRRFFGLSRPENGGDIIYRAAAEELTPGEGAAHHCETLMIRKGNYLFIDINDYMKHIEDVGRAFEQILPDSRIDPQGYCVEWYMNEKEMRCMVRMAD